MMPCSRNNESSRCHGRGREFESRRLRHSFQTTCADFGETIEDPKGHVFAPFLVSLFALADLPLLLRDNVI